MNGQTRSLSGEGKRNGNKWTDKQNHSVAILGHNFDKYSRKTGVHLPTDRQISYAMS